MVELMMKMTPIMYPLMWAGVGIAAIGLLLILAKLIMKSNVTKAIVWSFRLVLVIAIFFLAAHGMGMALGFQTSINFGDAKAFEFILVQFWQIGLALLIAALIIKFAGARNSEPASA